MKPPFIMPREMNTLPNVKELPGGEDAIREVVNSDIPDLNNGHGASVFRVGKIFREIFDQYPLIARYVRTDHPDCQGPMDVSELLWGSGIFLGLYDNSDLVHGLLRKVTDTYKAFLDKWFNLMPKKDSMNAFFGNAYLGSITIRDDSAMNLSPEMYKEFIFPYDAELLKHFGGGAIHSCGRVDHFAPFLSEIPDLHGFNLSQPEYNDMEIVFQNTADKGIPLVGLQKEAALAAHAAGRDLKGMVCLEQNSSV
ncbi:MAG: uroporphyrinogen decarboxylase family protein [Spirochaetales bacterium]|nr:uroporphyrinogen decarboxylase family protein [Spirochaetales bacterium]